VQDRRFLQDGQLSRHSQGDLRSTERGRIAAFADTRDLRRVDTVPSTSTDQRSSPVESRIKPPGGRLSPPQNLITPELRAFSTQGASVSEMMY
jgi:hypothetical protein